MKKIIALSCLTAVLLAGCGKPQGNSSSKTENTTAQTTAADTTAEDTTAADTTAEDTTAGITDAETTTHEADVPAGGLMDMYPAIYQSFIKSEFERVASENDGLASIEFAFRDVDANGIPELIFKRGTCEADYASNVFTLDSEGEIKDLGLVGGGHSSFCYDENTGDFVLLWGHMGAGSLEYYAWKNGALELADTYSFEINEQAPSFEDVLTEKGVRRMDFVSAYQADYSSGIKSYFYHADGTTDEFDGLYLDYMG